MTGVDGAAQSAAPAPGTAMRWLEAASAFVNRVLAWIAGLALTAMMLFTVADMALRELDHPVAGSYEVIGWLSAAAMALALGSVQQHRGHVAVDLLVLRLGPRAKAAVELLTSLAALLLFTAVAVYVARYARVLQDTGSMSETLRVIVHPWVYIVALGGAGLALALLIDFLGALGRVVALRRAGPQHSATR